MANTSRTDCRSGRTAREGGSRGARRRRAAAGGRAAFTLVELLVVMVVLAILVSLVVGVSGYVMDYARRKETGVILGIVKDSLEMYAGQTGGYPHGNGGPESGRDLLTALKSHEVSKQRLYHLPQDAGGLGEGAAVLDGYGRATRYDYNTTAIPRARSQRGRGGQPLIWSAGADGWFGENDEASAYNAQHGGWSEQKKIELRKDNVRSDEG